MTPSAPQPLPLLTATDFGPGLDHVAEAYQNGKVFAILHKSDPARPILSGLSLRRTMTMSTFSSTAEAT